MQERPLHFYSDGYRLAGTLYLPDPSQQGEKRPVLIPCSGYQGLNAFYPRLLARYLTAAGFVCLGFDYRGFAASEGPRGRVLLDEQVADICHAITCAQLQEEADARCLGLIGWGMGAAHVVRVAARDERVGAVAALNGFYHGKRWLQRIHTPAAWQQLLHAVAADRIRRVTTGQSLLVDPFLHYPLDPDTAAHVQRELAHLPGFGQRVTLQFTEALLTLHAEQVVADIAPRPLFIAHGVANRLHPVAEAQALYAAAREPKRLVLLKGKHNDFMYPDHPVFLELIAELVAFFRTAFAKDAGATAGVPLT